MHLYNGGLKPKAQCGNLLKGSQKIVLEKLQTLVFYLNDMRKNWHLINNVEPIYLTFYRLFLNEFGDMFTLYLKMMRWNYELHFFWKILFTCQIHSSIVAFAICENTKNSLKMHPFLKIIL